MTERSEQIAETLTEAFYEADLDWESVDEPEQMREVTMTCSSTPSAAGRSPRSAPA